MAADLIGARIGDNPHIWYKPETFPAVAEALAAALGKRDPDHAAEYKANLDRFNASFAPIVLQIAAIKGSHGGTVVTGTEPVFGYMADALGLKMLNGEFQIAIMNETEPSPSQAAAFERSLKDGSVRVLFYNEQVVDETTTRLLAIAKENGVPVVGVSETEPKGMALQDWFTNQLTEVRQSLEAKTQ